MGVNLSKLMLNYNQCEAVGRVADIIQIPAFLCRQVPSFILHVFEEKYLGSALLMILDILVLL
jgi:3-deoxy-D-manno-octulosonic acid (KDO) 8-phosphate synthase